MSVTKKLRICMADSESGEVLGNFVPKYVHISTCENLDGNRYLTEWIQSFCRGVQNHKSLCLQIIAEDYKIPTLPEIF